MTLLRKSVSLAKWFNSNKENVIGENIKGALHARIQAKGSAHVGLRSKHPGGGVCADVVDQTLFNWVKAHEQGKLKGAHNKAPVSAEQMEISQFSAELARVKMEGDILKKATAYFARGSI